MTKIRQHFALFRGGNPTTFRVRCVIAHKILFSPSFRCENKAKGCPIFMAKIWQSFVFGALWHTAKVSYLCIWKASVCSYQGKPRLTKASNTLTRVAYTGKPMSLADMDRSNHTTIIMHTMWHEYAFTVVTLNAYPHSKVKSTHNHEGVPS